MIWSVCGLKAGVGTSVVTAALALNAPSGSDVLVVDLWGDQPALLPVSQEHPGILKDGMLDWLGSEADVSSLSHLLISAGDQIQLLPAGTLSGPECAELSTAPIRQRFSQACAWARSEADLVLIDAGPLPPQGGVVEFFVASTDRRTLVVSPCYMALRRAQLVSIELHDLVEVAEPGRALRTVDIEGVFQQPVDVRIRKDPAVARAVDAGTLGRRLPRSLNSLKRLHQSSIAPVAGIER